MLRAGTLPLAASRIRMVFSERALMCRRSGTMKAFPLEMECTPLVFEITTSPLGGYPC